MDWSSNLVSKHQNSPNSLAKTFQDETGVFGWVCQSGPDNKVSDMMLDSTIKQLILNPNHLPHISQIITGAVVIKKRQDKYEIIVHRPAVLEIQRGEKKIKITSSVLGTILPTDMLNFDVVYTHYSPITTHQKTDVLSLLSTFSNKSLLVIQQKFVLYPLFIVTFLIVSFYFYQINQKRHQQQALIFQQLQQQVLTDLGNAQKLAEINPTAAKDLLLQTQKNIEGQNNKTISAKQLSDLSFQVSLAIASYTKAYHLDSPVIFYDLSLIQKGTQIKSLAIHQGIMYLLDQKSGKIFALEVNSKKINPIFSDNQLSTAQNLDFSTNKAAVLAENKIIVFPKKIVLTPNSQIEEFSLLSVFAENIYVLSKKQNNIYKLVTQDNQNFQTAPYLAQDISADFSTAVDLSIDGFIYILHLDGKIDRFSGGLPTDFHIKNLDTPLSNPSKIFSSEENNNLYVLDANQKRIVVFNKQGSYLAQYLLSSQFQIDPKILGVDEKLGKIFLVENSLIYAIEIR